MNFQSRNFAFVEQIDTALYTYLCEAEKKAYTETSSACSAIGRQALERFVALCIDANFALKERERLKAQTLYQKLTILTTESELKRYGYLKGNQALTDKNRIIRCRSPKVQCKTHNKSGKVFTRTKDTVDFLRNLGNSVSHPEFRDDKEEKVVLNIQSLLTALTEIHYILKCCFNADRHLGNIPAFDEKLIPVGEYEILSANPPSDAQWSKCVKEVLGFRRNDRGRAYEYALLRIYSKAELDSRDNGNLVLRNQHSFEHLSSQLDEDAIPGIPRFSVISGADDKDSEFYIVGYSFKSRPEPLEKVLPEMDQKERMKTCATLLRAMDELHHFESPMYHRVLNHECIRLRKAENKDLYYPYIVKFDYAKIRFAEMHKTFMLMENSTAAPVTVYAQAAKAGERHIHNRYRSPIWESLAELDEDEAWRAIDVYSLGVLITDILYGTLAPRAEGGNVLSPREVLKEMTRHGNGDDRKCRIGDELYRLIEPMLENDYDALCEVSLSRVASAIEEEIREL